VLALVGGLVVAIAIGLSRVPAAGGARDSWRDIVVPGKDAARVACSARERARTPPGAARSVRLRHLPRILLVLGGLCALAFFVENAWQSWGAVHLESDLDASPALGALAPALFAGAAAASRLGGHALVGRFDEILLMRVGAAAGAAATVVAALAPTAGLALAGIAVAGAGISICAPILFSLAGRNADEAVRGAAVSVVTTIAYLGFLVGPAAVGLLADATTLRASLAGAGAVALLLAALAGRARPRHPAGRPSQGSEH